MRWSKQLTKRDCGQVKGHAAGGLALTAAKWDDGNGVIDQVGYFRFDLFGTFIWGRDKSARGRTAEITDVKFCVKVSGTERGQFSLTLRYNPKWESNQNNYTTGISWGALSRVVMRPTMVGKTVSIYDPPSGQREPFFLEIR